ncbi:helix-turn-helix domain-containing protein [Escherichia coli]|nr:helix-turn-helix domain-containing protein [Escherichia coli]
MLDSTREKIRQKYTQAEIGRYMGVAQQTVWQWFSFGVPPKQVIPLCQLMKWEVTPHEIRPDGRGEIHIADTTMLDGDARLLYAGAKYGKFGIEILMEDKGAARRELLKYLATVKKPLPENSEGAGNTDLDDEWKRLRNEKLRTEIENLKKGVGGENNEIIIHNSLPMPGVDNVD